MRFVVVSPYLPHAAVGHGGGISTYRFLRTLAREHEVVVLAFQRAGEEEAAADLPSHGIRLVTVPFRSIRDRGWGRVPLVMDRLRCHLRSLATGRPLMPVKYQREAMARRLRSLLIEFRPHAVQIEYTFMAGYAREAQILFDKATGLWEKCGGTGDPARPILLLNTHEVGALPRLRRLLAAGSPWRRVLLCRDLRIWARYEMEAIGWADRVLCVTERDRQLLESLTGHPRLHTVPLGVDAEALPAVSGKGRGSARLLFVGSFGHPPNRDAARLLLERILPGLKAIRPGVRLDIVGREPTEDLLALQRQQASEVRFHGFVEDLDPLFERAALFVAPLFSGGGIKIKILEAMARGIPVLTTPIGIEGIDVEPGRDVVVVRDVDGFAREIHRLLDLPAELAELGRQGRRRILERYGWAAIVGSLVQMVEESAGPDSP